MRDELAQIEHIGLSVANATLMKTIDGKIQKTKVMNLDEIEKIFSAKF